MSVASATCGSGSSPVICDSSNSDISTSLGIQWGSLNSGSAFQPLDSSTPINNLNFEFDSGSNTHSGNSSNYTASVSGKSITLENSGKDLQINNGSGKLVINFKTPDSKTFTLNTRGYKGDIEVWGGGTFNGNFSGDFEGNISLRTTTDYGFVNWPDDRKSVANLTFNGNYTGNIYTAIGYNTFTFTKTDVVFKGNITSTNDYGAYGEGITTINFQGNATIGESGKDHSITADRGENTINFSGVTNKIYSKITTEQTPIYINWVAQHLNHLIFKNTTNANTLLGQISADGGGTNKIEFQNTSGNSVIGNDSTKNTNIINAIFGVNEIIFGNTSNNTTTSGNATNKILGNVVVSGNGMTNGKSQNIITFGAGSGEQIIDGNISAVVLASGYGSNTITFNSSLRSTITGQINPNHSPSSTSSIGGTNTITFSGSGENSINGAITSHFRSLVEITFENGTNRIGADSNQTDIIIADGGTNTITSETALTINGNIKTNKNMIVVENKFTESLNEISFNSSAGSSTINGSIETNFNGRNEISTNQNLIIVGDISIKSKDLANIGQNNFTLKTDSADLTLQGKKTGGTSHEISSLTATRSGTNTLTLDNSAPTIQDGAMETTIHSITNGRNLDVVLKGQTSKGATLILDNSTGTTLKSVTLGTGAQDNFLTFNAGANSVTEKINVGSGQDLTLTLAGTTTSLNLAGGLSGGAISVSTTNGVLSGGVIDGATLSFADSKALTLQNTSAIFTTVDASNASTSAKLTIGGSDKNSTNATISKLNGGSNLSVEFNGQGAGKGATLSILDSNTNNKTITLKNVSVASSSTNNTLDLSSLTRVDVGSAVSLADGTGLTLKLKDTNLTVTGGTDSRITDEAKGALTISVDSGVGSTSTATSSLATSQTSEKLNITNLDMVGSGKATLILKSNTEIKNLTAQAIGGNVLEIDSSGVSGLSVTTHNLSGNLEVAYKGSNAGTLVINGGTHTLSKVGFDTSGGKGALTLNNTFTTIASEVSASTSNTSNTLALTLRNSELELTGAINTLTSLDAQGSRIDLSGIDSKGRATKRKTLTIGTYKANSNSQFVLYAGAKSADKVTFSATDGTKDNTSATISVIGGADLFGVTYTKGGQNNVELVDASGINSQNGINITGGQSIIGGILAKAELIEDGGKYYIGKIEDRGLSEPYQEIANTALTVNYDLFLANFNSLNKRMGELRDNPHSQGVWARVFGGAMSNDFGAGSKSEYVTAQAGYDYSLTLGNANNYMGIAIAYGKSWTKSNDVSTGNIANGQGTFSLDEVDSNMVEVGIYNSYVMDSGWYNDTIFKFDYIMSEFSLSNDPTKTSTNNFAMVLSDEFGYRYKFAENEKGNWYIDPQVEVAFGYFNQSNFNRVLYDKSNFGVDINATQDSILNLRTRAGMSLGKRFNTAKGFASLYVGAFYEYDYIEGGNTTAGRVGGTQTSLNKLESNGRAIVNIGSNIELTDGVRMYIDVEKSFGDKQRTDMQFNFGARYSFGEKTPTLSYQEAQKKRVAPLKVEEKQEANTQESKTEAPANTEVKQ